MSEPLHVLPAPQWSPAGNYAVGWRRWRIGARGRRSASKLLRWWRRGRYTFVLRNGSRDYGPRLFARRFWSGDTVVDVAVLPVVVMTGERVMVNAF